MSISDLQLALHNNLFLMWSLLAIVLCHLSLAGLTYLTQQISHMSEPLTLWLHQRYMHTCLANLLKNPQKSIIYYSPFMNSNFGVSRTSLPSSYYIIAGLYPNLSKNYNAKYRQSPFSKQTLPFTASLAYNCAQLTVSQTFHSLTQAPTIGSVYWKSIISPTIQIHRHLQKQLLQLNHLNATGRQRKKAKIFRKTFKNSQSQNSVPVLKNSNKNLTWTYDVKASTPH